MAKIKIMEPLDRFIFQKLEELQSVKDVQKVLDAYSNLDEKPQEIIKALLALSLVAIPLSVILVFYGLNSSLKSDLETKRDVLSLAQNIIQEKSGMQSAQRKFLGQTYVGALNEMQNLISASISAAGLDSSKISVSNFEPIEHEGFITQASLDMKFQDLSNRELFGFLNILSERYKMKFEEVSVKKNDSSNLLEGVMTIHYYSKDNPSSSGY
ncbi:MAG: hypothetical protein WEB87_04420 [Bacteriovoracaceae bacterium]